MVVMTSLVPNCARSQPAIPATSAPARMPVITAKGSKIALGILGLAKTTQIEDNQPA